MISEYLASLIEGRMVFITVISLVVGYSLGWMRVGPVGATIWIAVTLFFELGLWITSAYVDGMLLILETGVGPDSIVNGVLLLSVATYPTILFLTLLLGRSARAETDAEERAKAAAMGPTQIVVDLDIISAHPQIGAAGWFVTKWGAMSADDRLTWVTDHISALRDLWLEMPTDGFGGHGLDLPMRLAAIDHQEVKR